MPRAAAHSALPDRAGVDAPPRPPSGDQVPDAVVMCLTALPAYGLALTLLPRRTCDHLHAHRARDAYATSIVPERSPTLVHDRRPAGGERSPGRTSGRRGRVLLAGGGVFVRLERCSPRRSWRGGLARRGRSATRRSSAGAGSWLRGTRRCRVALHARRRARELAFGATSTGTRLTQGGLAGCALTIGLGILPSAAPLARGSGSRARGSPSAAATRRLAAAVGAVDEASSSARGLGSTCTRIETARSPPPLLLGGRTARAYRGPQASTWSHLVDGSRHDSLRSCWSGRTGESSSHAVASARAAGTSGTIFAETRRRVPPRRRGRDPLVPSGSRCASAASPPRRPRARLEPF